jgi:hypothetical protein
MAQRRVSQEYDQRGATQRSERSQGSASGESERDVTNHEISIRAYELYERRGAEPGRDWDDWLEAENELRARRRMPGPTPS